MTAVLVAMELIPSTTLTPSRLTFIRGGEVPGSRFAVRVAVVGSATKRVVIIRAERIRVSVYA
jgi:hypothetical protein